MQAAFAGVDIDKKSPDKNLSDAKLKLKNPLVDFPDDVTYLDAKNCNVKIKLTNDPKLTLPFEQKWNEYRKNCCLGNFGPAAKRCSMNDTLWGRYLRATEAGNPLSLDVIKAMVEFDMARRELYPVDYKGHPDAPPPKDFMGKLKSSGKYTEILQRLNTLTQRIQNSGG